MHSAAVEVAETTCGVVPADLVFIQNGMLQPWLDERGLGDNTQVSFGRSRCMPSGLSAHDAAAPQPGAEVRSHTGDVMSPEAAHASS